MGKLVAYKSNHNGQNSKMEDDKQKTPESSAKPKETARNIVICLDGTWNNPESSTNVFSLFQDAQGVDARDKSPYSVKDEQQIRYYDEGVGSGTMRVLAGATGLGLSSNICQAYDFLCRHYQEGDQIFIFGFSRGAYTARSLVGLINAVGLLSRYWVDSNIEHGSSEPENAIQGLKCFPDDLLRAALDAYKANNFFKHQKPHIGIRIMRKLKRQIKKSNEKSQQAEKNWILEERQQFQKERRQIHHDFAEKWKCRKDIRVHFLGVWDTVGALGVPSFLPAFLQGNNPHEMHDTEMCGSVDYAYHALAIDERRRIFQHTPWTKIHSKNEAVEQRWFVGAHANIGGGVRDNRLHGAAHGWLQEKAVDQGLKLHHPLVEDPYWKHEPISDSYCEFMFGLYRFLPKQRSTTRRIDIEGTIKINHKGELDPKGNASVNESIDQSVWQYLDAQAEYRPRNLPLDARPSKKEQSSQQAIGTNNEALKSDTTSNTAQEGYAI